MGELADQIAEQINALPEGRYLTAKGLLHMGNRPAVDQALSRLTRSGRILRLSRGLYVQPVKSQFGSRPPSASKTLEALTA
jgi:predicted transcriptional regulator of viral defense system